MRAEGRSRSFQTVYRLNAEDIQSYSTVDKMIACPIPPLPPVFLRDPSVIPSWLAANPRRGTRHFRHAEPIVWFYSLVVRLDVPSGKDIKFVFPVTIGALHVMSFPPTPMLPEPVENPMFLVEKEQEPPLPTTVLPDWNAQVSIQELRSSNTLEWQPAGPAILARDGVEDRNSHAPTLSYTPTYLTRV